MLASALVLAAPLMISASSSAQSLGGADIVKSSDSNDATTKSQTGVLIRLVASVVGDSGGGGVVGVGNVGFTLLGASENIVLRTDSVGVASMASASPSGKVWLSIDRSTVPSAVDLRSSQVSLSLRPGITEVNVGDVSPSWLAAQRSRLSVKAIGPPEPGSRGQVDPSDSERRVFSGELIGTSGGVGLDGVVLKLSNERASVLSTTQTDDSGRYAFSVSPGLYELAVSVPDEVEPSAEVALGHVGVADDGVAGLVLVADSSVSVDLSFNAKRANAVAGDPGGQLVRAGAVVDPIVAGSNGPGATAIAIDKRERSIEGQVWLDVNANGRRDAQEEGIAAVSVELLQTTGVGSDSVSVSVRLVSSDSAGNFRFEQLDDGEYRIRYAMPSGLAPTALGSGSSGSEIDPHSLMSGPYFVHVGSPVSQVSAGLMPALYLAQTQGGAASIVGKLVGVNAESAAVGVEVELSDSSNRKVATTRIDSLGEFAFSFLKADDYLLSLRLPAGVVNSEGKSLVTGLVRLDNGDSARVEAPVYLAWIGVPADAQKLRVIFAAPSQEAIVGPDGAQGPSAGATVAQSSPTKSVVQAGDGSAAARSAPRAPVASGVVADQRYLLVLAGTRVTRLVPLGISLFLIGMGLLLLLPGKKAQVTDLYL